MVCLLYVCPMARMLLIGAVLSLVAAAAFAEPRPVILDPGHGGKDLGAVRRSEQEKDLALAITRKVRERLERGGIPVRLTRDADVFIPLDQRIQDSIDWGGAVFVSLHVNQDRNRKAQGIDVYAFGRASRRFSGRRHQHRLPVLPAPPRAAQEASAELASELVHSLRSRGLHVDQPAKAGFYVLKNPAIPSVLIELGFLSNAGEAARLEDSAYQDTLADAIAASLRDHLAPMDLASRSNSGSGRADALRPRRTSGQTDLQLPQP